MVFERRKAIVESAELDLCTRVESSLFYDGGCFVVGMEGRSYFSDPPCPRMVWLSSDAKRTLVAVVLWNEAIRSGNDRNRIAVVINRDFDFFVLSFFQNRGNVTVALLRVGDVCILLELRHLVTQSGRLKFELADRASGISTPLGTCLERVKVHNPMPGDRK